MTARSKDEQRQGKPNDNEGNQRWNKRVKKNRIKDNQTEESQGLGDAESELNQCFCPLRLINCLSGHYCRVYWSEKRQTLPLRSGELVVSIDDVAVPFTSQQRGIVFTCHLLCWPLGHHLLKFTRSRRLPEKKTLTGLLSSPTCNETLCCYESPCQSA